MNIARERGRGRIFKRGTIYSCAYYLRGKEYRQSTGETDEKKAEKFLNRKLKEVGADQINAKPFIGPQQERIRVSELLDALEADYQLRGKDSAQFKSNLKYTREYFGAWRAIEVSAEAVDRYITERLAEKAQPATVNRRTQLLKQAFRLAMDNKRLSSIPRIRHLPERGNERQGFFAEAQFRSVVENLPEHLRDFVLFGYLVGWRKSEIAALRWEDVDGDTIRLRGVDAKNGEPRMIVCEGELAEFLERRKAARSGPLVFHHAGEPIKDFRKSWQTACVMAGLGKFLCRSCGQPVIGRKCEPCGTGEPRYVGKLFHDFRRTAVRNMVRAGVPERVAMSVSGHKTRSIFDRYNIVSEADLRSAMERTQEYLKAAREQERQTITSKPSAGIQ